MYTALLYLMKACLNIFSTEEDGVRNGYAQTSVIAKAVPYLKFFHKDHISDAVVSYLVGRVRE